MNQFETSRRQVVLGVAAAGVAVPVLAACGSQTAAPKNSGPAGTETINCPCHGSQYSITDGSVVSPPAPKPLPGASITVAADKITYQGADLGPTSDIPVGGGKIYKDQKVVVTQPTKGTYKAFSAVCTHQGCLVSTVS